MNEKDKYQVMPDMTPDQFNALKADISERGILTPIDIDETGIVLDGHHRLRACRELGITNYPTIIRPGLTEEQKRMFARKSNMMRRHLNRKQIQEIIKNQLIDTPDWADNRIGRELGIDGKTVRTMRLKLEATSEIPKLDKLKGIDGKERPVKKPAIMISNERERDNLLNKLKEVGCDVSKLPSEFIDSGIFMTIQDENYDPFYGLNENEITEWKIFQHWICRGREKNIRYIEWTCDHIDWLRGKNFKTPDEWLGEKDRKFRETCGFRISDKDIRDWEDYRDKELASGKEIKWVAETV